MKNKRTIVALTLCLSVALFFACKKGEKPAPAMQSNSVDYELDGGRDAGFEQKVGNTATESVAAETVEVGKEDKLGQKTEPLTPAQQKVQPDVPVPAGFVQIHGGTFTMGSPASEQGRNNDESSHPVTVSSFYMAKYPVTQKEYQQVMGKNPSHFNGDNLPVEQVDWFDAVEYCNKRSQKEGLTPAYTISEKNVTWNREANGYRLPTEAEWEYACRAGTSTPFSTGNGIGTDKANYDGYNPYDSSSKGENRERTTAAGAITPNAWGLYDMHGNVLEWCWDWYGVYGREQEDPAGATVGNKRVLRGGSWMSSMTQIRSAFRDSEPPLGTREVNIGFRVARSV